MGLLILLIFATYIIYSYKKGKMSKNRAIAVSIMVIIAMFIGQLSLVVGFLPTLVLAFVNAFWTPKVIENFLNDLQGPNKEDK